MRDDDGARALPRHRTRRLPVRGARGAGDPRVGRGRDRVVATPSSTSCARRAAARCSATRAGHDASSAVRRSCRRAPGTVFAVVSGIGGARGYLVYDWAWEVRGAVDRLVGGVGLRRGRRDPDELRVGDALDFWRVEAIEPGRLLRLRAEMKVPGAAWLQFETAAPRRGPDAARPDRLLRPQGPRRTPLLVWPLSCPRPDLLGYDSRAGRGGRRPGARASARLRRRRARPSTARRRGGAHDPA